MTTLRWGIIGSGMISSWFLKDITTPRETTINHVVYAVGSSSKEKGEKFVKQHLPDITYDVRVASYDEVYNMEEVDCVYIALPHNMHYEAAVKAIKSGKNLLIEKPITINSTQAKELFDLAAEHNVFIMEAVWTRFFPLVKEVRDILFKEKRLGEVRRMFCDFGSNLDLSKLDKSSRLVNRDLAGGALLDIGIYSITHFRLFLDPNVGKDHTPFTMKSFQEVRDGVDYMSTMIFNTKDSKHGIITTSYYGPSDPFFTRIEADEGVIYIGGDMPPNPTIYKIVYKDGREETKTFSKVGKGFCHEADAVALDIAAGKKVNSLCPPEETLLVMGIMDQVRKEGGVIYPEEE